MKVRVVHYCGNRYIVKYELNWYSLERTVWHRWLWYDSLDLIKERHPVLFYFDEAKRFADGLTAEKIKEHIAEQEEAYDKKCRKLRERDRFLKERSYEVTL